MTLTRTTPEGDICQDLAPKSTNSRRSLENDLGQELTMNSSERLNSMEILSGRLNSMEIRRNFNDDSSSERLNSMEILSGRLNSMEIRRNFNDDSSANDCRMVRRAKLRRLLKENKDVFHKELSEGLTLGRAVDHVIETGDQLKEQTRQIEDLLRRRSRSGFH